MKTNNILQFIKAREREVFEEYLEARDVNGNLHPMTKQRLAVWTELHTLLTYINTNDENN